MHFYQIFMNIRCINPRIFNDISLPFNIQLYKVSYKAPYMNLQLYKFLLSLTVWFINKITKLRDSTKLRVKLFRIIWTVLNSIPFIILFGLITKIENDGKWKRKKKKKMRRKKKKGTLYVRISYIYT